MSYQLTEEEKSKLQAEFLYRTALANELMPSGALSKLLSHPAVLTIFGGIIIAAAGAVFQTTAAIFEADYTHARSLREQKYATLKEFTTQFDRDLTYLVNLKDQAMQLVMLDANAGDRYKITLKEREVRYKEMADKYMATRQHAAILLYIDSLFSSESVKNASMRLDAVVLKLENLEPPSISAQNSPQAKQKVVDDYQSAVDEYDKETERLMRELAHAMGEEIRAEPNTVVSFLQGTPESRR